MVVSTARVSRADGDPWTSTSGSGPTAGDGYVAVTERTGGVVGFGFRVGVPGLKVRVSTRGVRTSIGPRVARVHVGGGRTAVSSGLGPFFASTSVGGRRRTTARRAPRSVGPSPAQLERAQRAVERAQREAEREERIAELHELRRRSTTVHLQDFPAARPPHVPPPPELGRAWAYAEAQAFHLRGVGRFARSERSIARERAAADAPVYLAAEQSRLAEVHRELTGEAAEWWRRLITNDEPTVCEAVNAAFADNPAAGCAVGLRDGVLSVVMRHQDLDTLPTQTPGLTPAGRPTLKTLTKRDRLLWWLTILGSNVVATIKEALATAPGVTAVDLAVLTRLPDTQRLAVVAYGRWSRRSVESAVWREPDDALRFLDIGDDVACTISSTATKVRPLDTSRVPDLDRLLDTAFDDDASPDDDRDVRDPYAIEPFERWSAGGASADARPTRVASTSLAMGQTLVLAEDALADLGVAFSVASGVNADLTLLLLGAGRRVRSDEDFVFYNHPVAAHGAARLLGRTPVPGGVVERAALRLSALPPDVHRVLVCVNVAVDSTLTCADLGRAALDVTSPVGSWTIPTPADPQVRAMILAELYRHVVDGRPVWKLRAVGQGWAEGLAALARGHGVDIE